MIAVVCPHRKLHERERKDMVEKSGFKEFERIFFDLMEQLLIRINSKTKPLK